MLGARSDFVQADRLGCAATWQQARIGGTRELLVQLDGNNWLLWAIKISIYIRHSETKSPTKYQIECFFLRKKHIMEKKRHLGFPSF